HNINNHILFNTKVSNIKQVQNSWEVTWHDPQRPSTSNTSLFDCVIVASGFYSSPNTFGFQDYLNDKSNSGIKFLHSSQYKSSEEFQGQTVLVVGNSFSSNQIA